MKIHSFIKIVTVLFLFITQIWGFGINAQAVSKDKSQLALVYHHDLIRIYSLRTGNLLQQLKSKDGNIHTIDFSADGSKLISGSWSNYATLWDTKTGTILKKKNVSEHVMHAFFTPGDKSIALVLDNKGLLLYDKTLDHELTRFKVDSHLRISDNKQFVITEESNNTLGIVDLTKQKLIMRLPAHSYDDHIFFSKASNIVIVQDELHFHIWDIKKHKEVEIIKQDIEADSVALNYAHAELWVADHHKLEIWDYHTHKRKKTLTLEKFNINEIEHISFSDYGDYVAITVESDSGAYKVIVLDTKRYNVQTIILPKSKTVYSTEFIDRSRLLLHSRSPVEIWDVSRKQKSYYFKKGW